jgi:hypothetical protein
MVIRLSKGEVTALRLSGAENALGSDAYVSSRGPSLDVPEDRARVARAISALQTSCLYHEGISRPYRSLAEKLRQVLA